MRISAVGILTVLITGCAVAVALAPTVAVSQSHLPPCQADSNELARGLSEIFGLRGGAGVGGNEDCVGDFSFHNGDRYVGEARGSDGKWNGQGTMTYGNGDKYVGEWRNGKPNGWGTYISHDDGRKYVGEWRDGERNGQGTTTWPDGEKYVGQFKDGLRDGQGTLTFANGRTQTGLWRNGEFVEANSGPTGVPSKSKAALLSYP
jgi:hypothetical protein